MTKHEFGGPWTLIKLELLERYLKFFNTALRKQPKPENPFDRVYIDAFAGTGICDIKVNGGERLAIKGSAKIAVDTQPPFHQVHLVDLNSKHIAQLQTLDPGTQATKITIYQDDANTALRRIIDQINWRKTRGVLFLDPYGMAVEWKTLEQIANTHGLDVWYLFPLSAVYRQAARNFDRIDESKAAVLDRVLGTPEWRQVFYEASKQDSLLEMSSTPAVVRTASPAEIATYVHQRLVSVFKGWVSPPIFLPEHGAPLFVLFFAVSNPSQKAVSLSKKAANHLFQMLNQKKIGGIAKHAVEQPDAQIGMFSTSLPD
jgi:three-Cys-motif partner protein